MIAVVSVLNYPAVSKRLLDLACLPCDKAKEFNELLQFEIAASVNSPGSIMPSDCHVAW